MSDALLVKGYNAGELHGDLSQAKRERVMKNFKDAKLQYLVSTDIAARGIDVTGITHIFNYDIPEDAESYIHRIGRTARAGKTGVAVTFVTPKNVEELNTIERKIKMSIKKNESKAKSEVKNEFKPKRKFDDKNKSSRPNKFTKGSRFEDKKGRNSSRSKSGRNR